MEDLTMENTFPLEDLWLSAYLICHGFKLIKTPKNAQGRVIFHFQYDSQLPQMLEDYIKDGLVRARSFRRAIFRLRKITDGNNERQHKLTMHKEEE